MVMVMALAVEYGRTGVAYLDAGDWLIGKMSEPGRTTVVINVQGHWEKGTGPTLAINGRWALMGPMALCCTTPL